MKKTKGRTKGRRLPARDSKGRFKRTARKAGTRKRKR